MSLLDRRRAYIGVGSNLGGRVENCQRAVEQVRVMEDSTLTGLSPFYRTEPVGVTDQDWYVNGVIRIETGLSARDLLGSLLSIETLMGRVRRERWGPRVIDLDILLYGTEVIDEEDLTVPHPLMHTRRFVLVPLAQLDPDLVHPVLKRSMRALCHDLSRQGQGVSPVGSG